MIAYKNLSRIREITNNMSSVLDLGGGRHVLPFATHVIDLEPFDSYVRLDPITDDPPRFSKETWIVHDACSGALPFEDKFFDFCFCSHLLEDVRDPIRVCSEMIRVSRSGYIEVPSRQREIFAKSRFFKLKTLFGKMPEIGFYHHRWFVEIKNNEVIFTAKDGRIYLDRKRFITRSDLGRKMNEDESATFMFWEDSFMFREDYLHESDDLREFRDSALRHLRKGGK